MTLVKWNRPNNYYPTYSRFFDNFFNDLDFYTPKAAKSEASVNVIENKDDFVIELAAPGLNKKDFNIKLDNDVLSIEVNKEEKEVKEKANYTRREFNYASFSRSFNMPESIDSSKIDANYTDGVLRINLPKKEEAKVQPMREIKIS
jgi:HSP20 family protein